jgi:hypothetical protein
LTSAAFIYMMPRKTITSPPNTHTFFNASTSSMPPPLPLDSGMYLREHDAHHMIARPTATSMSMNNQKMPKPSTRNVFAPTQSRNPIDPAIMVSMRSLNLIPPPAVPPTASYSYPPPPPPVDE